jgi:heme/copper-type cytochrome/quinol oxidase subunit 2
MYDGTDVALVLGGLVAAVLAGLSLVAAVAALTVFVYRKANKDRRDASFSGRLAVYFTATAVLCGISVASGYVIYDLFEHTRGHSNPPSHVLAVAVGSLWGPIAAGALGVFCCRKKGVVDEQV